MQEQFGASKLSASMGFSWLTNNADSYFFCFLEETIWPVICHHWNRALGTNDIWEPGLTHAFGMLHQGSSIILLPAALMNIITLLLNTKVAIETYWFNCLTGGQCLWNLYGTLKLLWNIMMDDLISFNTQLLAFRPWQGGPSRRGQPSLNRRIGIGWHITEQ